MPFGRERGKLLLELGRGVDAAGDLARAGDLLAILVPGVHAAPVEAGIALQCGHLLVGRGIGPDGVLRRLAAGVDRPVAGVALVGAVGVVVGRLEHAHVEVLDGQVVHRRVAQLVHHPGALRAPHRDAADLDADLGRDGVEEDFVVRIVDPAVGAGLAHGSLPCRRLRRPLGVAPRSALAGLRDDVVEVLALQRARIDLAVDDEGRRAVDRQGVGEVQGVLDVGVDRRVGHVGLESCRRRARPRWRPA